MTKTPSRGILMAVHALNAEHRVSARTKGARHPLYEIRQPVQVELPLNAQEQRKRRDLDETLAALEREAKEVPVTDGTNAEATGAEPTPKVLPLPSLDERVEMHLRAVSGSDDATISRSRAAVRERILDAIADDIVPQILERKKWVEISKPTPSADPLVSRVIGICVVVFRNIFDLGSRLLEFLSSLRPRTLAWSAAAAVVILVPAAVLTALLVKEQERPMQATFAPAAETAAFPQISDEKIAALVAGGRQLVVAGDIPNARLVLQQAAEADNATAALELGATYDPTFLQPAMTDMGDVRMARLWYEKAKDLGSTEAAVRLERLRSVPNPRR
jgi:hypothetical protein